tara:strand:- start:165 stop:548 length:384 start_codon:yes stop_codon:yes gene_type:complete
MFSFGWSEIALTLIIVVIVVGPKEIPNLLRQIGSFSKSIKKISREFKKSLNEIADESDLKDVKKSISDFKNIKEDIDPTKDIKKEIDSVKESAKIFENQINDINKSIDETNNDESDLIDIKKTSKND